MLPLFDVAQIKALAVDALNDATEGIGIKGAASPEIGDTQGGVAAAHDVEGWVEDGFRNGHLPGSKDEAITGQPRDGGAGYSLRAGVCNARSALPAASPASRTSMAAGEVCCMRVPQRAGPLGLEA
jgi:hypothetical protein